MLRKTRALVNLDHIQHNLAAFRQTIDKKVKIAAVVKANAYGHGIVTVAGLMLESQADYLAVATVQEAVLLRCQYPAAPLLVMGHTPDDLLQSALEHNIALTVFSLAQCRQLNSLAQTLGTIATVHIKIDTGFNRLGYKDHDQAAKEIAAASKLRRVRLEGIFSHLALHTPQADANQHRQLLALTQRLAEQGITFPLRHICDSIGAVAYPGFHLDMVRLGALLYGYCSRPTPFPLRPALTLVSEVAQVKTIGAGEGVGYSNKFQTTEAREIATLPIGYADGLPRNIWQQGHVLINGQSARFAGLPCMDQCMVDVTGLKVAAGDEAVIFGSSGASSLPLELLARWCETNRNELLTRVSARVPRVYFRDGSCLGSATCTDWGV